MILLVNERDEIVGEDSKEACHRRTAQYPHGRLHRAFSLFIFTADGHEMLIQQRSNKKLTFPGKWSNAVCSHPGETEADGWEGVKRAAVRRTKEELGVDITGQELTPAGTLLYQADSCEQWTEWEVDYLLTVRWDCHDIQLNPDEVQAVKWIRVDDLESIPNKTPWYSELITGGHLKILWPEHK